MANDESKISVTIRHNIDIDELKKKIDFRKESFIINHHGGFKGFSFHWFHDIAYFNVIVSYDLLELGIEFDLEAGGYVVAKDSEILVHIESNIPLDMFNSLQGEIEKKIHEE